MSQHHHAVCESPGTLAVARFEDREIARSTDPVVLREFAAKAYPPVVYFPPADVDMTLLKRSQKTTTCPIKGTASYYRLAADDEDGAEVAWTYEEPVPGVEAIRGHLAFYPDRIDVTIGG
jgi:uncharacterized protein (DUF427 family)